MSAATKSIPVYSVEIQDSDHKFKLEKSVLLELPNSGTKVFQNSYQHLKDIEINDRD